MILDDPGRTPMRMFWLCGTFFCSSSSVHGGCQCCLGVALVWPFWSMWVDCSTCPPSGAEKLSSVLVVRSSLHQVVPHNVVPGWSPFAGPLKPQITVHHVYSHHNLVGLDHVDLVPPLLQAGHHQFLQLLLICGGPKARDGPDGPLLHRFKALNVRLGPRWPGSHGILQVGPHVHIVDRGWEKRAYPGNGMHVWFVPTLWRPFGRPSCTSGLAWGLSWWWTQCPAPCCQCQVLSSWLYDTLSQKWGCTCSGFIASVMCWAPGSMIHCPKNGDAPVVVLSGFCASDPETRHIRLHLLQLWQAWFFKCGDSNHFWDSIL